MTFHFLVKYWIDTHLTGATVYHSELGKWLTGLGHTVTHGDYIPAEPCTIITTPFPHYHQATRSGKRVVFIQHHDNRDPYDFSSAGFIYCAKHVERKCSYRAADSVVFYPFNRYKHPGYRCQNGGAIAMMNCNDNKGGARLAELAKMLPQLSFIGVNGGYGNQKTGEAPNLNYIEPMADTKALYMATSALLLLSKREGLPTVALEAMAFGIPVVALDIPGTREALGEFVFPDLAAVRLELQRLAGDADYYYARSVASVIRAKEVEEGRDWDGLRAILGLPEKGGGV